jgi:hypothetical protein
MDIEQQREYLAGVERTRRQFLAATGRPSPAALKLKGALIAYIVPRLALDAAMPDLDPAVAGVDAHNFRHHRKHVADAVRRAVKGRLGRDANIDDIDRLLEALEQEEEPGRDTSYDSRRRRARDEEEERVSEPGMSASLDPSENPFAEAEAEDAELEELRDGNHLSPEAYDRLRRRAADRRRQGRDTPYHRFDARRRAHDDPPDFAGKPEPGGGMVANPSSVDRPGMRPATDPGAKDKRRRFGQDAKLGFSDRFGFTRPVSDSSSSSPIKVAAG